jgi:hypothetical protein
MRGFLKILRIRVADSGYGRASVPARVPKTARRLPQISIAHDIIAIEHVAGLARRFDDSALQAFSRLILAQVVARRGGAAAAAALFDEIMVAVTVGDVVPIGSARCTAP